jgi:regulator of replication initiation timing
MSANEDLFRHLVELFANPRFNAGYAEFAAKAQQEGMEAAKRFWGLSGYGQAFPYSGDFCERLADWHKAMGFVALSAHNKVLEENAALKAENQLLKNMLKDMQHNLFSEGGEKARQAWNDIMDKQIKMNAEVANSFFEALRQFKTGA